MKAFCTTHNVYLDQMQNAFNDYASANGDSEKEAIAVRQGKSFVSHAKVWANILSTTSDSAKESVNIMTDQLSNVHEQLKQQLIILHDKLAGLQKTLEVQNEAMDNLKAALWGSILATLVGKCLTISVVDSAYHQRYHAFQLGVVFCPI